MLVFLIKVKQIIQAALELPLLKLFFELVEYQLAPSKEIETEGDSLLSSSLLDDEC